MMKNQIKIQNPCPENWENMQNSPEGKFCEKCSKCVVDFTDKTDEQIKDVFESANGKEICGRISSSPFSKIAAGIILITNLTFVQAQTQADFITGTEQKTSNITKVSGKLVFKRTKKEIANAEVFLVCKSKYIKTTTNESGNFILEIPNELIERKNVLYFNFEKLNNEMYKNLDRNPSNFMSENIYENTSITFKRNDTINDREFQIDSEHAYIGGAIIMEESPPNYYYFNGKSVSERKFEKLKTENPNYTFFILEGKEAEVIAKKSYLDTVRLLYSN